MLQAPFVIPFDLKMVSVRDDGLVSVKFWFLVPLRKFSSLGLNEGALLGTQVLILLV